MTGEAGAISGKPATRRRVEPDEFPVRPENGGNYQGAAIMKTQSKYSMLALLAAVSAGAMATGASAAGNSSTLVIRHQLHGCHSWSANGDSYRPKQSITLRSGGSVSITNNDVMPHKLVKLSGHAVKYVGRPNMNHMSATLRVTFPKAGVYTFTTKAGEDYMQGMKTTGEDNVLRLKVTVS